MIKYTKEFIDCVEDILPPESTAQQLEEMGVLTERTLSARRHAGTGPKYTRKWGRVFYRRADILRFLRANYQLPEVDKLPPEQTITVCLGHATKANAKNVIMCFKDILKSYFSAYYPGDEPRQTKDDVSLLCLKNMLDCC